jgi:hypothetical protein
MRQIKIFLFLLVAVCFLSTSCENRASVIVSVHNKTAIDRPSETVELLFSDLRKSLPVFTNLEVREHGSNAIVLSQLIDSDSDGQNDLLVFQANVGANSSTNYSIIPTQDTSSTHSLVYSRFVPERTDDYAWENNKIAFRTYGPTAQKMIEESIPGGTLSSGIDCWLKKVDYPIINKWYQKYSSGEGSYHKDTGEGVDNFHVGTSRGCGGLGVYLNQELFTSKNFVAYKTIANGPIRTEFVLDYADWKADNLIISEQKRISLDLESNLMHVKVKIDGTETISVGLTLHENDGETSVDTVNGWFSYWQPQVDSELGTAIVIDPKYYLGYTKVVSDEKDKSQLLVHLKVIDGIVEYKTGFGWKESKQFKNKTEWNSYLNNCSKEVQEPLLVVFED